MKDWSIMKLITIFGILVFALILRVAFAKNCGAEPFLACNPAPATDQITESKAIIDGVDYGWKPYEEVITKDGQTICVLADLETLTDGQHTAQAQFRNVRGESAVAPDPPYSFTKKLPDPGSSFVIKRTDR